MKSENQKRGRASKRKGKTFEQEFCRAARGQGLEAERNYQDRGEVKDGPDVYLDAPGWPRLAVECKHRKSFSSSQIIETLKTNNATVVKITNRGSFVAIDLETYWTLLKLGGKP